MRARQTTLFLLAAGRLALVFSLAACGKKDREDAGSHEQTGPQSAEGAILESAQKAVDEANARTRKIGEAGDRAAE